MKKRVPIPIIVMIIIPVIIIAGFIVITSINTIDVSQKILNSSENNEPLNNERAQYSVSVSVSKSWKNSDGSVGAQYDGYLYNNTNYEFTEWELSIPVPEGSYVDSCWDNQSFVEGDRLIILHESYNSIVSSSDSRKFGLIMYTPSEYAVSDIFIEGRSIFNYRSSPLFMVLIAASVLWALVLAIIIIDRYRTRSFEQRRKHDEIIITQSITTFVNFIDAKDPYTKGHSSRVALYAKEIAKRMHMPPAEQQQLYYIALMHDVGKIGIPDAILNKKGALTPDERHIIESHTSMGGDMLKSFTSIDGIIEGALYHHERYDGKGYPKGIAGQDIPLYARIICICDSYDAMSSNRCYRKHLDKETILTELHNNSGSQFDPDIVQYMIDMIEDGFVNEINFLSE
ncbi:MAG: HD-GYP domain-containing protein [Butyrivibrio sp.]|nr:HD-GYP domain-containing protein [Butyrivibrio sp.]